jgi:hypothetical protein
LFSYAQNGMQSFTDAIGRLLAQKTARTPLKTARETMEKRLWKDEKTEEREDRMKSV